MGGWKRSAAFLQAAVLATSLGSSACGTTGEVIELMAAGDSRELRERPDEAPPASTSDRPDLFLIAFDGMDRRLLYDMLEKGELPALAALLGGDDLAHAHLSESLLATLPSTTMAAWVTTFTGKPPAYHGVTGNEFFIRRKNQFAAPVPVTFSDPELVLSNYNDGYTNGLVQVPSVYQRMRERDPHLLAWVAMHQYHAGADELLMTDRGVLLNAMKAYFQKLAKEAVSDEKARDTYATLDEQVFEELIELIEDDDEPLADVIDLYIAGTDLYAHVATEGPDAARRDYLKEVIEPQFEKLYEALAERHALNDRYFLVIADHGHTEVQHDEDHALGMDWDKGDPPALLGKAGYRVRPFQLDVPKEKADYEVVLAYQGAIAYVYVADRSTCPERKKKDEASGACDWKKPPRYVADVLKVADAFFENDRTGKLVPEMKGALDMVLVRQPKPPEEVDEPFVVYVGNGKTQSVGAYLKAHPHPDYVAFEERLGDLGVGPFGEQAGDVLLIASNGAQADPKHRYYFSHEYHSWHGSPNRKDSEIPLIVAHHDKQRGELQGLVQSVVGKSSRQQKVTDLMLALRFSSE